MNVTVVYYAALRDKAKTQSESVSTSASTLKELYDEVAAQHGFLLPSYAIKAVVGDEFVEMGAMIEDGMQVSFLPPVAGG